MRTKLGKLFKRLAERLLRAKFVLIEIDKNLIPFCQCGCGKQVTKPTNDFLRGHNHPRSKEKKRAFVSGIAKAPQVSAEQRPVTTKKLSPEEMKKEIKRIGEKYKEKPKLTEAEISNLGGQSQRKEGGLPID